MPTRPRTLLSLALAAAAVLTLGCGALPLPDPDPAPAPTSGGTRPTAEPSADVDGTMTVDEFEKDTETAVDTAAEYWAAVFADSGLEFRPVGRILPYLREGEVACGGEPMPANNAAYCPDGDFIAYDADWAVAAFRQVGDAFLYYLIGHEYAHAIQDRLNVTHRYTIDHELQADCMAGAYLGDEVRSTRLGLGDGDLDELRNGLIAVADDPDQPWFAPGAHGTAQQRSQAFFNGYENSLEACDLS
ncbi:neutral zinc metallopeptidase [Catellatospora tritici]|uniref:neutral zinc metallopeptidase n=1 Tax=Catellatospora tritici TaxID=2851566 RepID=UPI001C2CF9C8|nr:neutral zinc metallopeptidase [Catellatospora tritici]MBV1853145.1 neutral zinc metallopeptidase [Catellatospora tritici]